MNPPISQLADTFQMQIFILGFNQMLSKSFFSQRFFSQLKKKKTFLLLDEALKIVG